MLILPSPAPRHWRVSLWLVLTLLSGAAVAALMLLVGAGPGPLWAVGVGTVLVGGGGLLSPAATGRAYRGWNASARWVARAISAIGRRLCFFVVLRAAACAGSTLAIERPVAGRSLWEPRAPVSGVMYLHPHAAGGDGAPPRGWVGAYVGWAWRSGNAWALCLLPFWGLLAAFRADEAEAGVPTHTYTLF